MHKYNQKNDVQIHSVPEVQISEFKPAKIVKFPKEDLVPFLFMSEKAKQINESNNASAEQVINDAQYNRPKEFRIPENLKKGRPFSKITPAKRSFLFEETKPISELNNASEQVINKNINDQEKSQVSENLKKNSQSSKKIHAKLSLLFEEFKQINEDEKALAEQIINYKILDFSELKR